MKKSIVGIREVPARTIDDPQVEEWTVMANARRICKRRYQRSPNWVLAMEAFGLGSTWAWALCERIGIDPDGRTMGPFFKTPKPPFDTIRTLADATPSNPPSPEAP